MLYSNGRRLTYERITVENPLSEVLTKPTSQVSSKYAGFIQKRVIFFANATGNALCRYVWQFPHDAQHLARWVTRPNDYFVRVCAHGLKGALRDFIRCPKSGI